MKQFVPRIKRRASIIQLMVPMPDRLGVLLKECGELIQAALNYHRVITSRSHTSRELDRAWGNLLVEYAGVLLCMETLGVNLENASEDTDFVIAMMEYQSTRWIWQLRHDKCHPDQA